MCEPSNLDRIRELSKELEGQQPPTDSQIELPAKLNRDQKDSYFMQALRSLIKQLPMVGSS